MKLLVIEDDPTNSRLIQQTICEWGHRVAISNSGKDALVKACQNRFDLVLLDMSLPDMEACDLIPTIQSAWPDVKIVTMTDSNSLELERRVRKYGVIYYMIKPINFKELKSIVVYMSNKLGISDCPAPKGRPVNSKPKLWSR